MQLDYIMVKHRFRNSVKNACSLPGADVDSDHNPVMMKVRLRLKRLKTVQRQLKWNAEVLKRPARGSFVAGVTERMKNVEMDTEEEQSWIRLKQAILHSAEENIGKEQKRRTRKQWVIDEMLQRMDERRKWENKNTTEA